MKFLWAEAESVRGEVFAAVGALGVAGLLGFAAIDLSREAESGIGLQTGELRLSLMDRWIGNEPDYLRELFDHPVVPHEAGLGGSHRTGGWRLVWVLDPGRCPSCVEDLGLWNVLSEDPEVDAHLVVLQSPGLASAPGAVSLSSVARSPVSKETRGVAGTGLGPMPASTIFLLAPNGVVVLADGWDQLLACEWSGMRQVAALVGAISPDLIRQ